MPAEKSAGIVAHITQQTTLAQAIKAWKFYLDDQRRSPHTVKAFTADVNMLAAYLPPDRTVGTVTTQDIDSFLNWLQTKRGVPCSPKTLARRVTAIKSFFRWLRQSGVLVTDPAEKVLQHSVISPLPEVLTTSEVEAVLKVADQKRNARKADPRPYTLLSLLLTTGIKKGETLAINPNHLDFNASGGPVLFVRYASPRNRYKERKISLPTEWDKVYQDYEDVYQPSDRVFPWSPRRLEYILEDLGVEAGLKKHLSFDMCRWTAALQDWRAGVEPEAIRQKMGVSKIQWREVGLKLRQLASDS